ncbi:YgdI/YgdR family lipoprotein [Halopseudomonas sp.]|uniref:YgdI/YgdR family lipoprotein n=1 Tax=Halopseudomonas sp. TaxID=2901191 RepID=UPI00311F5314
MKHWKVVTLGLLGLFILAGCGNDYLVRTSDGQVMEAEDKPQIDEDTGMIEFEDATDRDRQMKQENVEEIIER